MVRRLSEEDKASIKNRRKTETLAEIAKDYEVAISTINYCTSNRRKKEFSSKDEFKKYQELRDVYIWELKLIERINSGYGIKDIRTLKGKKDTIAITLLEEKILDDIDLNKDNTFKFDKKSVENDFKEFMKRYFQIVSGDDKIKSVFEVIYDENKCEVLIIPGNLESRAFSSAYKTVLKKELKK